MADRSVVFRFLSDTKGLKKGFSEASKGAQETETVFAKMTGRLGGLSTQAFGMAAGIAGVGTGVVAFAAGAVRALGEEQVAAAQTSAAILSTGSAAKVTAGHVGAMATSLAKLSGVDDEVVQGGENLLLTFVNIKNEVGSGNDVFDQATKAALNMSVALGEDMSAAAMQVGKALNDPIAGVTALRRVGVQLTDQQKASIGAFVQSGDVMSAQKVILAELTKEFGGSAEAYGKTIPGAIGKARTAFENFSGDVLKKAMPAVQTFGQVVGDVVEAAGPAFATIGHVVEAVGGFFKNHTGLVVAAAAAYLASLVPAVASAAAAFAMLAFDTITTGLALMVVQIRAAAAEMGVLKFSLSGIGWGLAIAGVAGFAQGMFNAKRDADALAESIKKPFDLSSQQGLHGALAATDTALATATTRLGQYHNPIGAFFTNVVQTIGPGRNALQNAAADVQALAAQQKILAVQSAHYDENVQFAAAHLKINHDAVIALAKATGIDLTGGLKDTTEALYTADAAQKAAASGWGVYNTSVEEAIAIQNDLTKAFETAMDTKSVYTTAVTAADTAAKASSKTAADSIRDQAKAHRDSIDARHDAEKAALDSETITGKASKAAHDQRVKELGARQKAENDAADATVTAEGKKADAIGSADAKVTLSMETYRKAVAQNTKDTLAWMRNLAVIASRGGGDFVDKLAELGPEAAGMVAEIASSSKPKFDQFAGTMRAGSKTAVDAANEEFKKVPDALGVIGTLGGETLAASLRTALQQNKITPADLFSKEVIALLGSGKSYNDLIAAHLVAGPPSPLGVTAKPPVTSTLRAPSGPAGTITGHAEGHFAQIAPAGSWRIWAEPETGGEAYIPLAYSKRAGSMALVAQVANAFGQAVVPMAAGGTWGVPAYTADRSAAPAGMSSADASRLIGALERNAKLRPAQMQNVFPPGIDPVHVAQKIAWRLRPT